VFLGDYLDRGPGSRGVLEQVMGLAERCVVVPLPGNPEEMLLAALEGQSELRYWCQFGGAEALASYGYRGRQEVRLADLQASIPAEHLRFIEGCRDYFETVRHVIGHAYYEPDRPLRKQQWGGLQGLAGEPDGGDAARASEARSFYPYSPDSWPPAGAPSR
jgi:serine/threonine protein phosphatase 1